MFDYLPESYFIHLNYIFTPKRDQMDWFYRTLKTKETGIRR